MEICFPFLVYAVCRFPPYFARTITEPIKIKYIEKTEEKKNNNKQRRQKERKAVGARRFIAGPADKCINWSALTLRHRPLEIVLQKGRHYIDVVRAVVRH